MARRSLPKRLWTELRFDVVRIGWHLVVNVVGGSMLLPRPIRFAIYRLAGLDIRTVNISPQCVFTHRHVAIGRDSFLNIGVIVEGEPVSIGARTQIGPGVMIATAHHGFDVSGLVEWPIERKGVEIGDDCFVATRAVVLPGVRIASGVAVAAGAVVAHDLVEQGLYAGVPARLVRRTGPGSDANP